MSTALFGETEARYAALAGLVHGARVLDLREHGDARCIDALVTAGAGSITVCAPETVRRELTTQNVELQLVPPLTLPLGLTPGAFDVVICFDLLTRVTQDPTWTSAVREVLSPDGAIVISTQSAEEAQRILGPAFGVATVFAQSPLVGHMLYDVTADELEPELDRTWADDTNDEPLGYLVVFAQEERHNEKLTLVQMPFTAWAKVTAAEAEAVRAERDHIAQERDAARNELALLGGELASVRRELAEQDARATNGTPELDQELTRHRRDRVSLEAQIADLLEESATMSTHRVEWQARLDGAEQELATERTRVA
jgi:hypothetical protein